MTSVLKTEFRIRTEDAQGYQETLTFRIKDATYGATTLPTDAHMLTVINDIFGADLPSTSKVIGYEAAVVTELTGGDVIGGDGGSPTSERLRFRNDVGGANWIFGVPGLNKAAVTFDPSNPNAISTSDININSIRTALNAADLQPGDPKADAYTATSTTVMMQSGIVVDGRRSPKRTR